MGILYSHGVFDLQLYDNSITENDNNIYSLTILLIYKKPLRI